MSRCALPGRLELADDEVRDGAHTPEAADWLLERLPEPRDYVVVASILGDKDATGILERLARAGATLVATRSSNPRALPPRRSPAAASRLRPRSRRSPTRSAALARAHELGPRVLVTGSLYLLADLAGRRLKCIR